MLLLLLLLNLFYTELVLCVAFLDFTPIKKPALAYWRPKSPTQRIPQKKYPSSDTAPLEEPVGNVQGNEACCSVQNCSAPLLEGDFTATPHSDSASALRRRGQERHSGGVIQAWAGCLAPLPTLWDLLSPTVNGLFQRKDTMHNTW